jgi:hypothetical protein
MTECVIAGVVCALLGLPTMIGMMWLCVKLWPDDPATLSGDHPHE